MTTSNGPVERSIRGFNSATAVTPWMTGAWSQRTARKSVLQFGHGGDAVDDKAASAARKLWDEGLQFGHGGDAVDDR